MAEFSDEVLMRFADGELDDATAAELEAALADDDALAERLAVFLDTRMLAKEALQPMLQEPLPPTLRDAVQAMVNAPQPVKLSPDMTKGPRRSFTPANDWWRMAAAAAIGAVAVGLGSYLLNPGPAGEPDVGGLQMAGIDIKTLHGLLDTVAAGGESEFGTDQRFKAIASFRDNADTLCREFEVGSADKSTVISVACDKGGRWDVRFAVVAPGEATGYAPASSSEALEAYLAAINAGAALTAEEEKQALAKQQGKAGE